LRQQKPRDDNKRRASENDKAEVAKQLCRNNKNGIAHSKSWCCYEKGKKKGTMTMKFNDATEAAYKNGYADGVKETEEKLMLEVRDLRIELKAERAIAKVQKAEIEKLKDFGKEGFINLLGNCLVYSKNLKDYNDMRKGLKAEAYKEFAERLKECASDVLLGGTTKYRMVTTYLIDRTLIELTKGEASDER
jgi:hypothetical protein